MIVFRAGLTGCLAGIWNKGSTIIDASSGPTFHKAVLRFRSSDISDMTGIPFKKIKVTKAVWDTFNERFVDWSPHAANCYSKKVIGGIYDRSIENLDPVIRWLAPDTFHEQLIEMIGDRIHWNTSYVRDNGNSAIISTMPMPKLLQLLGEEDIVNLETNFNSIYVTTLDISIPCDVHQTVYFPFGDHSIYRVTLEGRKMIIESTHELEEYDFEDIPLDVFGIGFNEFKVRETNYKQQIGKIAPVDDELRKELIHMITMDHGIYSLGRTAIWKNILLDDVYKDIQQINTMMYKSRYERMLGK